MATLSEEQRKAMCGVLMVEVLDGSPGTLKAKEKYLVNVGFTKGLTSGVSRMTQKAPPSSLTWNKGNRCPLLRKLTGKEDEILLTVYESGFVTDEKIGFGTLSLEMLFTGNRLESAPVKIQDATQQEICQVNLRVYWENDNVPDMGDGGGKVNTIVRGNASQQAIDLQEANAGNMPAAPTIELPPTEGNDYSVRVRIHKARNLQSPKDQSAIYDPLVAVVILDETQSIDYAEDTNNPTWDDEVVMNFEKVGANWLNTPMLIKVMDHHIARPNSKIGSLQLDLSSVYQANAQHNLEYKWHVLHRDTLDGHVMGFIKLSIWVGDMRKDPCPEPGPVPAEDEDDIVNNLLSGPGARFEEITMHCDVFRAEDLPVMDISLNPFQSGSSDPYVRFQFGTKLIRTNFIKNSLSPVWNTTVQLPMMLPSLTNNLTIGLWDDDTGSKDDLISQCRIQFNDLLAAGKAGLPYYPARFLNFYGSPRDCDADFNDAFKAMCKGDRDGLDYRGRLLMRMSSARNAGKFGPMSNIVVNETTVEIRAVVQVLQLSMCPPGEFEVKASVGLNSAVTNVRRSHNMGGSNGLCAVFFGEEIVVEGKFNVVLPVDPAVDPSIADQIPDIILHLSFAGKKVPFSALRFPANKLIDNHKGQYQCKNMLVFSDPAKKSAGEQPSDPLLQAVYSMGITNATGHRADELLIVTSLNLPAISSKEAVDFKLETCVFQGRQLPAGDDNGLSDPFIRVSWADGSAQTGTKQETLNPIFNEFIVVGAKAKERFPDIVVEVWDWDFFGSNTFLCKTVVPFEDADGDETAGKTRWYKGFTDSKGKALPDTELLLNFEVVRVTERNKNSWDDLPKQKFLKRVGSGDTYKGLVVPKDKAIPQTIYKITANIFSLRHMRSFHLMQIKCPSIVVEVAGHTVDIEKVYGSNPDFNKKFEMYVELPEDPDYLPHLNFRVFENRFGPTSMVGATSIKIDGREFKPERKKLHSRELDDAVAQRLYKVNEFKGVQQKHGPGAPLIQARVNNAKLKTAGRLLGLQGKKARRQANQAPPGANSELYDKLLDEGTNEVNYDSVAALPEGLDTSQSPMGSTRNSLAAPKERTSTGHMEEMSDKSEDLNLDNGEAMTSQVTQLFLENEEQERIEAVQAEADAKQQEENERLWFDRFDPEGLDVKPEHQVSRLGQIEGVLPPNHGTFEDYYGPFDDEMTRLKLTRGWGKDKTVAGSILVDIAVETMKHPPAGIMAAATAAPTPGKSDADPMPMDAKTIEDRQPVKFVAHIYIIGCKNLAPKDDSILGKMSDPYPVLQLLNKSTKKSSSKITMNLKDDKKLQTLNPEFFLVKEMNGTLPKQDTLKISIFDYDKIGSDELIGFTEIDLEARWHSRRGYKTRNMTTLRQGTYTETRLLKNELGQIQGSVEMWVDMYDVEYQKVPLPLEITPPPPVPLELRCIVWNTRDVIMQETSIHGEAMTDIYVRCWMDGMNTNTQSTDVHYRSLDGTGNFNWRMKFPFVFEPRTRKIMPVNSKTTMKSFFHVRREQKKFEPILHVQIWDNDLLPGTDDFIGESVLRLMDLRPSTTRRDPETLLGIISKEVSCCCNCYPFNTCCISRVDPPEHMLTLKKKQERAAAEARHDREVQEMKWRKQAKTKVAAMKEANPDKYTDLQLERLEASLFNDIRRNAIVSIFKPYMPTAKKKRDANEGDDGGSVATGGTAGPPTAGGGGHEEKKSFLDRAREKIKKKDDDGEGSSKKEKGDGGHPNRNSGGGNPNKVESGSGMPNFDDLPKATETPKYWFTCRGPNGGGRIGDVQLSFQIVRADVLDGDNADPSLMAGHGRSNPNALPEPKRPDSSFFWLSSPWKSAVHILWKQYKWYIMTILCLGILALVGWVVATQVIEVKTTQALTPVGEGTPIPIVVINVTHN